MIQLTFWKNQKKNPGDFDEIITVHLKTVNQIPDLVKNKPKNCTMVSKERSSPAKRNGKIINKENPKYFTEVWRKGQPLPKTKSNVCQFCGKKLTRGKV